MCGARGEGGGLLSGGGGGGDAGREGDCGEGDLWDGLLHGGGGRLRQLLLLPLPPLGPPVLEPHLAQGRGGSIHYMHRQTQCYLHTSLRQVNPAGQLLASEHIWIVGFLKHALQLPQLEAGEGRAVAPLLLVLGLICEGKQAVTLPSSTHP